MRFTKYIGALAACSTFAAQGAERPNILMICIDDLRQEGLNFGGTEVIAPNLKQLSKEGRLFTHHYVQAPTSGASRAMMLTGMSAKKAADVNNFTFSNSLIGSVEGDNPESFIHHLRRNGYTTVGMGKVSHSDNGHIYPPSGKVRELPYSWDEFINDPKNLWPDTFDAMLHGYDGGRVRTHGVSPAYEFLPRADNRYADYRLADLAIERLQRYADEGGDKPMFMAVGFYKPHLPFVAPKRYWGMYEDIDIGVSKNPNAPEGVDAVFLHSSNEFFRQYSHPEVGGAEVRVSDAYARNVRRAYYSAITFTDAQVGRVMDKLRETGLDRNTIVIVWSDHGWHLGDHTIWGKHSTFERALNSTLIVKTPTMKSRGIASDALVASIDLYPTICDYAGIKPNGGLDGVSFKSIIERGSGKTRDFVLSYWNNIISIRDSRYRLSIFKSRNHEAVMLFDHEVDPLESRNIASENRKINSRLRTVVELQNNGYLPYLIGISRQ